MTFRQTLIARMGTEIRRELESNPSLDITLVACDLLSDTQKHYGLHYDLLGCLKSDIKRKRFFTDLTAYVRGERQ